MVLFGTLLVGTLASASTITTYEYNMLGQAVSTSPTMGFKFVVPNFLIVSTIVTAANTQICLTPGATCVGINLEPDFILGSGGPTVVSDAVSIFTISVGSPVSAFFYFPRHSFDTTGLHFSLNGLSALTVTAIVTEVATPEPGTPSFVALGAASLAYATPLSLDFA